MMTHTAVRTYISLLMFSFNSALISRSVRIAGDTTNRFLNENWREAFKTYRYLPEEAFGILFRDLISNVLKHFPYKELFPE